MKENGSSSRLYVNLQPHQEELQHLSELAGVYMNPSVARIIVELLNMQVEPEAIFKLLKLIRRARSPKPKHSSSSSSRKGQS